MQAGSFEERFLSLSVSRTRSAHYDTTGSRKPTSSHPVSPIYQRTRSRVPDTGDELSGHETLSKLSNPLEFQSAQLRATSRDSYYSRREGAEGEKGARPDLAIFPVRRPPTRINREAVGSRSQANTRTYQVSNDVIV